MLALAKQINCKIKWMDFTGLWYFNDEKDKSTLAVTLSFNIDLLDLFNFHTSLKSQ